MFRLPAQVNMQILKLTKSGDSVQTVLNIRYQWLRWQHVSGVESRAWTGWKSGEL